MTIGVLLIVVGALHVVGFWRFTPGILHRDPPSPAERRWNMVAGGVLVALGVVYVVVELVWGRVHT
jgi:hypothetical protein